MYVTRQELRDLLEVNENTLKSIIKRGTLNERIQRVNYKLISQCKVGRNTIYELEPLEKDLWTHIQDSYNIRQVNRYEHTLYSNFKLLNYDKKMCLQKIMEQLKLNCSRSTCLSWDNILFEQNILKKNIYNSGLKAKTKSVHNVVYRMIDLQGNIVYVGKTNNLSVRINSHANEPKKDDWFLKNVYKIEYMQFDEYGDCSMAEIYFIAKFKPKYNTDFYSHKISLNITQFDEQKWEDANFLLEQMYMKQYDKGDNYDEVLKLTKQILKKT